MGVIGLEGQDSGDASLGGREETVSTSRNQEEDMFFAAIES